MQLLIALSLVESCSEEYRKACFAILKGKIVDYWQSGKAESLEEYALHRLNFLFAVCPQLNGQDNQTTPANFNEAVKFLINQNVMRPSQSVSLRLNLESGSDLLSMNPTQEDPSYSILRVGSGMEHLE